MRKNIEKVIQCFQEHTACRGDSKGTISTDGEIVWSYTMPIAWRVTRCEDHVDCVESPLLGEACALENPIRIITYASAPTMTTRSQVRALEYAFPRALRVITPRDFNVRPPEGRRKHR